MENGWMENVEIIWVDDAFPDDTMEILVDEGFDKGSMELKLDPQDDSNDENIDDLLTIPFILNVIFSDH